MKCPKCGEEIFDMGVTVSDVLHDEKIPEHVKDLITPYIQKLKDMERGVVGAIELAYRRGQHKGEEGEKP